MDPIANMLVQIKNAGMAGLSSVVVPYSSVKFAIAELLSKEGFVGKVEKKGKKVKKYIAIEILYNNKKPHITNIKRVSKPSRRMYMGVKEIRPVRHGYGMLVLSTPKGIMRDREARKEHVGGEALFEIY